MSENFDFNRGVGADVPNFLPVQFPAENDPLDAHSGAKQNAGKGVNGHLGGGVNRDMGGNLTAQLYHAQILNDESIHTAGSSVADHL